MDFKANGTCKMHTEEQTREVLDVLIRPPMKAQGYTTTLTLQLKESVTSPGIIIYFFNIICWMPPMCKALC